MINESKLAKYFWTEALNTTCYVQNRFYIKHILNKILDELLKGITPYIAYFHQLGCTCYILNTSVYLKNIDAKVLTM